MQPCISWFLATQQAASSATPLHLFGEGIVRSQASDLTAAARRFTVVACEMGLCAAQSPQISQHWSGALQDLDMHHYCSTTLTHHQRAHVVLNVPDRLVVNLKTPPHRNNIAHPQWLSLLPFHAVLQDFFVNSANW